MANILKLAQQQIEREGLLDSSDVEMLILDRAVVIRKWLDKSERNKKVAISRYKK